MKPLQDCEFTAFISYAHADDAAWYGWVGQFRSELERGLGALLRGVRLPRLHLSGENGPVAGALSDELMKRVEASFALVIVVHDNYAQSDWCLKELEYFRAVHGDEGLRQRLYIVALSEAAMLQVSGSPTWRRLMASDDQVWLAFYDPADRSRPIDIYLGPGLVAPAFRGPFERLRGDLVGKIRQSLAVSGGQRPATVPLPLQRPAPWSPPPAPAIADGAAANATPVLIGFVAAASQGAAAGAAAALVGHGVAVRALTPDVVFSDFADFADAERLVLPFDDNAPMMTSLAAGGHLEVQRDAWLKKGKSADSLLWLDLRAGDGASPAAPLPESARQPGAAGYVARLGVAVFDLASLAARLRPEAAPQPSGPPQAARIYIESNRHERTLWEPLGEQIRRRWDDLCRQFAPTRVPPLSLRARGLPVDQIDAYPSLDDADGVVLLWGRKTSEALVAQINKVENKMSAGRDAPPGIVAYLMPPQQSSEPVPAWGWQVLRFNAADEQAIAVFEEEGDELERFLKKVFARRQQREGEGTR